MKQKRIYRISLLKRETQNPFSRPYRIAPFPILRERDTAPAKLES